MKRFLIYEVKFVSLKEESFKKTFKAIREDHVKMGILNPRHDMTIDPEPLTIIEAKDAEQAVALFEEKRESAFF